MLVYSNFLSPNGGRQSLKSPSIAHTTMKCPHCKAEISGESKFCPGCGEKVNSLEENDLGKIYEQASGCWFLIGMAYGTMKVKKDEEGIKELENNFRRLGFYEEYSKALTFAKTHVLRSKLNEEGQKATQNGNAH